MYLPPEISEPMQARASERRSASKPRYQEAKIYEAHMAELTRSGSNERLKEEGEGDQRLESSLAFTAIERVTGN